MRYQVGKKTINIPDAEINDFMTRHELTKEEAIQLWLEDNDYEENEEVEALTKKAKENKAVQHEAHATEKKERKKVERKPDETKEGFIKTLAEMLTEKGYDSVGIVNKNNTVEFKIGEKWYKILFSYQRDKTEGDKKTRDAKKKV